MRISDWSSDVCSSDLRCCSVCRSKMRHLVCVCVYEGRADRGVHSIGTTGRISRQLVEPIDKAQHIRHEDVSDEEGLRQPFASRSEEHTSELQSLMRISYAAFCLKKKQQHP